MRTVTIIATDHDEGTTTMAAVAGVLAVIRSQKQSGTDDMISHRCQQKRCSMGVNKTHVP
jgi:hypothetical protein